MKSTCKCLAIILSLVFVFSMSPLSVAAVESDSCDHSDDCCGAVSCDSGVAIAHEHVFMQTFDQEIVTTNETHTVIDYTINTCTLCTYTERVVSNSHTSDHSGKLIGHSGTVQIRLCSFCGREYYV